MNGIDMASSTRLDRNGIIYGVLGAVLFSTKPILIKIIYQYGIPPETLMTLRLVFSLPFYLFFGLMAWQTRKQTGNLPKLSLTTIIATIILGMLGYYVASYLDLLGLTHITAQFERLILFTYPIFVAILSVFVFKTRLTTTAIASLALTFTGLAIIFTRDLNDFGSEITIGALLVLGASLVFSVFIVFSKNLISQTGPRLFTSIAMSGAAFAIMLHYLLIYDLSGLIVPAEVYLIAGFIAVFATVLPSYFLAAAISRIGPGPTSIVGSAGPVFTTLMAIIFLDEIFTIQHFIGMSLVIAGVTWLALSRSE